MLVWRGARVAGHPFGERIGESSDHGIVEQVQRLAGDGRIGTLDTVGDHLRQVKGLEDRRHVLAAMTDINRTSPTLPGLSRGHQPVGPDIHGVGWSERGIVQSTGDGQDAVADHLGIHSLQRHPPQQTVLGIDRLGCRTNRRDLLVGRGVHHHAVQLLDAPFFFDQRAGQPVQQFWMRRPGPGVAKIRERLDQAAPEVVEPDPVDHDAGRQRVIGIDEPAGQRQPATRRVGSRPRRLGGERGLAVGQHAGDARTDPVPGLVVLATSEQPRGGGVAPVPQGPDPGLDRHLGCQFLDAVVRDGGEFLERGVLFFECRDGHDELFFELAGQVLLDRITLFLGGGQHLAEVLSEDFRQGAKLLLGVLFLQGDLAVGQCLLCGGDLFLDRRTSHPVLLLFSGGQVWQDATGRLALGLAGDK